MNDTRYDEAAKKKELASRYLETTRNQTERLKKELNDVQADFLNGFGAPVSNPIYTDLVNALKNKTTPSKYIAQKFNWLFGSAIPHHDKAVILYFADRLTEYAYSDSITRRSFRSNRIETYALKLVTIFREYKYTAVIDAPLEKILNRALRDDAQAFLDEYKWFGCGYTQWQVAYALDHNDSEVEGAVRRILTEENSSGAMTTALVRGVLCSRRSDFHDLLGKLLLAAKLQEGLRQVICENADCGTREGFLAILKVIHENNLIRFSSVKRAVGTWLGLFSEEARDLERVSEKSVDLIVHCLGDESAREEFLASEDAMKIHIALWSYGFYSIETTIEKINHIALHGSEHQLLVAGYLALNLNFPQLSHKIAQKVICLHHDKEKILAVWLPCFLPLRGINLRFKAADDHSISYSGWFDSKAEIIEYYQLFRELRLSFSGKSKTFSPCVFPWHEAKISKSDFAEILCTLAALSGDSQIVDDACGLIKECAALQRSLYFSILLHNPQTPTQRAALLEGLIDKVGDTRQEAHRFASVLVLSEEEYRFIEGYLRFKAADIRAYVMDLLLRQTDTDLTACIARLLASSKEEIRLGGLDMLVQLNQDEKRAFIAKAFYPDLSVRLNADDLTAKEKLLLESLIPDTQKAAAETDTLFSENDHYLPTDLDTDYTELCAQTFSKYFPESKLPELIRGKKEGFHLLDKIKSVLVDHSPCGTAVQAAEDLASLSRLIDAHKTDSFVNTWGETVLLGNVKYFHQLRTVDGSVPLGDLWRDWVKTNGVTNERLLRAQILYYACTQKTRFSETCKESIRTIFGMGFEQRTELPYSEMIEALLDHLCKSIPHEDLTCLASAITIWFICYVPDSMVMIHMPSLIQNSFLPSPERAHFLAHQQIYLLYKNLICKNDADLKHTFPLAVASAERCVQAYKNVPDNAQVHIGNRTYVIGDTRSRVLLPPHGGIHGGPKPLVGVNAYLFAAYQGIITKAQLYEFLLAPDNLKDALSIVSSVTASFYEKGKDVLGRDHFKNFRTERVVREFLGKYGDLSDEDLKLVSFVSHIYETLIPIIITAELSRGDSPAAYSEGISSISRIYGADYFAQILSAMGNDTIDRTASHAWHIDFTRKTALSYLLSVCIPSDTDSVDTLRAALVDKKIKKRRLVEAALFSPEWIPIIGQYLEIPAFESACYYFMAHMKEDFDNKRKAMIARFTPLSDEELNLGAFDVDWFRSAYEAVGEKEFELIYDAAKYVADGAKHSRARKYADAALGKFRVDETEKTVSDKRNKDLLMAYALIPLDGEDDLCRRYLYIQKFRKESKRFGAQRAASEAKVSEMALKNLATNAGYADTMRLTLRMEAKVVEDSRAFFEEQTVDGVTFKIVFNDNGKTALMIHKDGKPLKSVPAKLKKNETVTAMTELVKTLTEQYRRTRTMLEQAMEDSAHFTFGELLSLSSHPVVYPMLRNLVLVSSETVGFLAPDGLVDELGTVQPLSADTAIRIAHPFDLYQRGCWRNYQKYLFDHEIAQPFRQVFRELYIKTADEIDTNHSLRYAGNQIQPKKTAATLKSRRWIADVESGLQKVYYKENIVAQICALADWFSPADIEAPTLEWVCFTDRKTYKPIKIADIPDIVFSEVMRDVDLAVSVAHAGGVDPETSHSTIEMREAILTFVLPMFRLTNVRIEGHHAIINGKLAEYSIHLGSGVVHQLGGAMIPVLPVHSQHRGKVFLPFVDDDPKTAEIISKVLLFAEDNKIKDPMILSAITR